MEMINRYELPKVSLPGRVLQNAVGKKSSAILSESMAVGFATYSAESGQMSPHRHDEESIYIVGAKDAYLLHGEQEDALGDKQTLSEGMILHFPKDEWHVFRYEEGGYLDIIFIYGKTDDLRPEKMEAKK